MDYRRFGNDYVVRIDRGEEVMEQLNVFFTREKIFLANVSGLGACDEVTVALYDGATRKVVEKTFKEYLEIASVNGTVTEMDGKPYMHIHITVCDINMNAYGGHLKSCRISNTCELMIHVVEGAVSRQLDWFSGTNVNMMKFE